MEQFHCPEKMICLGKEYFSWICFINISHCLVLGLFPIREVSFCDVGEGNGTPLQYSCLENPIDGGAWGAAVHGVVKSQTWLRNFTFTFHFHALEKEMATHSSVLAWRIPGMGEPGRLPSVGSHRIEHDWSDLAAAAAAAAAFCKVLGYYFCPLWLHICVPTPQFIWWRLISKVMVSGCCCLKSNLIFFASPWTEACQAPSFIGFTRQEYWSGLPFPFLGNLPNPGIELLPPTLQADSLLPEWSGKPRLYREISLVQLFCCIPLCDPTECSTPGFPFHHKFLKLAQTHVHQVSDAIHPSHPLSFPSSPTFNLSQHQGLFKWFSLSHQVAKVLEFQLHQSFQWLFRTDYH